MPSDDVPGCPVNVDTRKSAPLAAAHVVPDAGSLRVKDAVLGRAVMRSLNRFRQESAPRACTSTIQSMRRSFFWTVRLIAASASRSQNSCRPRP